MAAARAFRIPLLFRGIVPVCGLVNPVGSCRPTPDPLPESGLIWANRTNNWHKYLPRQVLSIDQQDAEVRGNLRPGKRAGQRNETELHHFGWSVEIDKEGYHKLCNNLQLSEAVEGLDLVVQQGSRVSTSLVYAVLKRCSVQKNLALGRLVHGLAIRCGYESDKFLANHFICMYASHRMLEEATQVFSKVSKPDSHMWASIILAHARHGEPSQAIQLYRKMRDSRTKPDSHVFVATFKACAKAANLTSGKKVHADLLGSAVEQNTFVANALIDMYAKCGSLVDARRVFDKLPARDVVTWNTMIAGYVHHGLGQPALSLFASMQRDDMNLVNNVTFVCLLKACISAGAVHQGKQLHMQIQARGLEYDVAVGSCLVDMYAKCGRIEDARRVFDRLPSKDVVSWTSMIGGYVQQGLGQEALSLYASMEQDGTTPANSVTFLSALQACGIVGALHKGKQLHSQIQERGLGADVVLGSCLVDMYAKCGSLGDARRVFGDLQSRNVVTWNALLNGYAQHSNAHMTMHCFQEMQLHGVKPDHITFICLLVACSHRGLVDEGKRYFKMMEDHGIRPDVYHYTCMVDLLGRSGRLDDAEKVLQNGPFADDVVGWTSLLSASKSHGDIERGTRCFVNIIKLEPDSAAAYVLLRQLYADGGMWEDVNRIERWRTIAGATTKPAHAFIEVNNKVETFVVGEERDDISSKLKSVNKQVKEAGCHVPQMELVLESLVAQKEEDVLCGHAEKLALAYGLLNTPPGKTLLVTKNLRMCNDCHSSTKVLSLLERREIIVRDAHRVHHFVNGCCSCGDHH